MICYVYHRITCETDTMALQCDLDKLGWWAQSWQVWGARVAQWWERLPPTNVARVRILASTPYVGWVCCWFSPFLREVFLRVLRFSPLLKNQHFQIAIRSGMHGHVSTSSYKLLSDPWVNKLQQITTNGFLILLSVTKCQFTALDHQS